MQKSDPTQAPVVRTENDLFELAATFSRRQVLNFRVPGTTATHKVECVIMEPADLAMFASAIGIDSVPSPREVFVRPPEEQRRRLSDRMEVTRQLVLEPDDVTPPPAIGGEGGHDVIADYLQRAARPVSTSLVDARRYQRLRILGVAPAGTEQLAAGTVLCFQNLDDFTDADIAAYPSRGESTNPTDEGAA